MVGEEPGWCFGKIYSFIHHILLQSNAVEHRDSSGDVHPKNTSWKFLSWCHRDFTAAFFGLTLTLSSWSQILGRVLSDSSRIQLDSDLGFEGVRFGIWERSQWAGSDFFLFCFFSFQTFFLCSISAGELGWSFAVLRGAAALTRNI